MDASGRAVKGGSRGTLCAVEVVTDRSYRLAVDPDELWSTLTRTEHYRTWWPWLRRFDGGAVAPKEVWACAVHPPLSYPVRFDVCIDEVDAPFGASATIRGDVTGSARLEVRAVDDGSVARLVATLAPGNGLLRMASRFAAPLVRRGHDWVLDAAARQFIAQALP